MNSSIEYTNFNQTSFENNDRTAYSDLNPLDRGQSLYTMSIEHCVTLRVV